VCLVTASGCVADVWPSCPVCLVTESEVSRWPMCGRGVSVADVWPSCPVCLVTDGRCVLSEVSRVFGD